MADVDETTRRREIRRRKILENSEARLRQITEGYNRKHEVGAWKKSDSAEPNFSSSDTNDYSCPSSSAETLISNRFETLSSKNYEEESQESTEAENYLLLSSNPSTSQANGITQRQTDAYTFPKKVSDAETRSYGRTRADSRRNSSCKQLMMETFQFSSLRCTIVRPWLVLATAVVWKLVLVFCELDLYLENLVLPYLLLELLLYIWIKLETRGTSGPLPTSLLSGALLLCGVSPTVISSFTYVWSLLHCFCKDFALYLFSFVVLHIVLENYM